MSAIKWETKMVNAVDAAMTEEKPVLLNFYNPACIGSQQMDASTFSQEKVIYFIKDHFVPLRMAFNGESLALELNVTWTPTLIILDDSAKEHQRSVGFFEPDELIATLLLGVAKVFANSGNFGGAKFHFDKLLKEYPQSDTAPEAVYFRGVALYKEKESLHELKRAYERLQEAYPASSWAKRAAPYRLL